MTTPAEKFYRNYLIFARVILEENGLQETARRYGITQGRAKQILNRHCRRQAPRLYRELISMRYEYCDADRNKMGPSIEEMRLFKDALQFGEMPEDDR